ncbi:uncharacterized protein LOC103314328 [Tribolium castaneum]|uniref:uncharacterized protein LOC135265733 n=1 Tax=Tribolium castaneum TaxID=7070 RepID=UPI0001DCB39E|nr:PREDICTED: uncharacterized protein LOC103314328 [Tribolium castaneum]|eukprot:XP_008198311.1 PREDICTED: uncharacterized protein LOC103314328 [Tribolium castaneum]
MCHGEFHLHTQDPFGNERNLNEAAVNGIIAIGGGYYNLEEFLCCLNISSMSYPTYKKYENKVSEDFSKAAVATMKEAAEEEILHAKEIGAIDQDGCALVPVVADGTWGTRSNKSNFNSLTGAAAIVGAHTGKVLYLGVRNKFCMICSRQKERSPTDHVCTKNHIGSSGSMESQIILQGFKTSVEMYNIKYNTLIGDGDSSTYKKIIEGRPYNNLTVEKIECRNHLLRNLRGKLKSLVGDRKFPLQNRKLLEGKIMRLSTGIRAAITYRKKEADKVSAAGRLRQDILNCAQHVFGEHKDCANYFCQRKTDTNTWDTISTELKGQIQNILRTLASHSRSLLCDVDNNVVEGFNSIVAKFIGGKRINYSLSQSYETRCMAAVVSFNSKHAHMYLGRISKRSRNRLLETMEIRRRRKAMRTWEMARKKGRKVQATNDKGNADYGENCEKPDMTPEIFEENKKAFLQGLEKTDAERVQLQESTRLQAGSGQWLEERRKLLTASNFGRVCKMNATTSPANTIKSLLYQIKTLNVPSINHGKVNEEKARLQLMQQENVTIVSCGLFVNKKWNFLGASPDGLILDLDSIVEIKCPYSAFQKKMSFEEAVISKKITFWKQEAATRIFKINKNHDWYYQIQGQLQIADKESCLLGVWLGDNYPLKTQWVMKDNEFWEEKMLPKLQRFYFHSLLPELVDPRHIRNMPIRDNK